MLYFHFILSQLNTFFTPQDFLFGNLQIFGDFSFSVTDFWLTVVMTTEYFLWSVLATVLYMLKNKAYSLSVMVVRFFIQLLTLCSVILSTTRRSVEVTNYNYEFVFFSSVSFVTSHLGHIIYCCLLVIGPFYYYAIHLSDNFHLFWSLLSLILIQPTLAFFGWYLFFHPFAANPPISLHFKQFLVDSIWLGHFSIHAPNLSFNWCVRTFMLNVITHVRMSFYCFIFFNFPLPVFKWDIWAFFSSTFIYILSECLCTFFQWSFKKFVYLQIYSCLLISTLNTSSGRWVV
jgi:hypothetical protein